MFLPLDPSNGLPIYRQIIEQVRRMVASGALAPGARVPSVRDLAVTLAVNPLTVGKAYGELEREGVLEMRRGLGMFVAARKPAVAQQKEARRQAVLRAAERLVLEAAQARLGREETQRLVDECWRDLERTDKRGEAG